MGVLFIFRHLLSLGDVSTRLTRVHTLKIQYDSAAHGPCVNVAYNIIIGIVSVMDAIKSEFEFNYEHTKRRRTSTNEIYTLRIEEVNTYNIQCSRADDMLR